MRTRSESLLVCMCSTYGSRSRLRKNDCSNRRGRDLTSNLVFGVVKKVCVIVSSVAFEACNYIPIQNNLGRQRTSNPYAYICSGS